MSPIFQTQSSSVCAIRELCIVSLLVVGMTGCGGGGGGGPTPALTVSTNAISLTGAEEGLLSNSQTFDITNTGDPSTTLNWTIKTDKEWLQVTPLSGSTTTSPSTITVSAIVTREDEWKPVAMTGAPSARRGHSAVWTGSEMIIWGGYEGTGTYWPSSEAECLRDGYAYDPAIDTWSTIPTTFAPTARLEHSAAWTGTEMIVWGGTINGSTYVNTGGRFNPVTGQWQTVSTTGAPTARFRHCAVWTGKEMIVWGGGHISGDNPTNTGKKYYPSTNAWGAATSTSGAPAARYGACAVWSGSRMIIWGGGYTGVYMNDGASYDPVLDSWAGISSSGAPSARIEPSAACTGNRMIVWGGDAGGTISQTGGIYDLALNTWGGPTRIIGAPTARSWHSAVWTGKEMIVWGGRDNSGYFGDGKRYTPPISLAQGTYNGTVTVTAPGAVNSPKTINVTLTVGPVATPAITAVPASMTFTASASGPNPAGQQIDITNSGQQYSILRWQATANKPWLQLTPSAGVISTETDIVDVNVILNQPEAWTGATSTTGAPAGRENTSAVWTGAEMIVWGGFNGSSLNTGAIYDPATNTWLGATSTANAPSARWGHSAVWTGRAMIVWGGSLLNTGALYDPVSDMWTGQTTVTGAPSGRRNHSAVWTGSKMVIFGGTSDGVNAMSDMYTYDPSLNTWTGPLSPTGTPPTPRWSHTAVWTGSNMIVWGGYEPAKTNTGAIYDPMGNIWVGSTQTTSAPAARGTHSATWTGTEMIVWGGDDGSGYSNTGGRYDPLSNTWVAATTTTGALSSRRSQQAIWTGKEMILWGGYTGGYQNTGAKYLPQIALSAGTYTSTITVSDPNASNNPQTVDVTLTVNP